MSLISLTKTSAVAIATVAGMLALAPAAEAGSWQRNSTTVGPAGGVWTSQGGGSCTGGRCAWGGTTVGPNGGVYSRQGSAVRTAPGQWQVDSTVTGPRGGAASRSTTWQRTR